MGGEDKGLIVFQQQKLIEHVLLAVKPQIDNIVISANRNLAQYAEYGYPVIEDGLTDFQGPLAGILAAMENVTTDYLLTIPCDGPYVADNYVERMLSTFNNRNEKVLIASDGVNLQPVYTLLATQLKSDLKQFLQSGHRKLGQWLRSHPYTTVDFSHLPDCFTNFNTPHDLTST